MPPNERGAARLEARPRRWRPPGSYARARVCASRVAQVSQSNIAGHMIVGRRASRRSWRLTWFTTRRVRGNVGRPQRCRVLCLHWLFGSRRGSARSGQGLRSPQLLMVISLSRAGCISPGGAKRRRGRQPSNHRRRSPSVPAWVHRAS